MDANTNQQNTSVVSVGVYYLLEKESVQQNLPLFGNTIIGQHLHEACSYLEIQLSDSTCMRLASIWKNIYRTECACSGASRDAAITCVAWCSAAF